jgi:N-acyl-D-amino-acid deacylase
MDKMKTQKITRRRFLRESGRTVAAVSLAGGGLVLKGCTTGRDFDLVIKNGLVLDGLGNTAVTADIGITGPLIKSIGKIPVSRARSVLEARGLAVAPGFIDVHDHTDVHLLANPRAESAVHQGVTTLISGNCGSSPFPIAEAIFEEERTNAKKIFGIELTWRDLQGFLARLEETGLSLNYGTLVGHGAIRGAAMGFDDRDPRPEEMEKMKALLADTLKNGALGLSSGLEYTPGSFARPAELIDLCRLVARAGGVYATHMRDEGDRLIESLDETIDVAQRSGVSVQISHFKAAYPRNWAKIDAAITRLEEAKKAGVDILSDRYPYIAGATGLDFNFPLWAREGTTAEFLGRLKDPALETKLKAYLAEREKKLGSWDKVVISDVLTEKNKKFEGRNILEAAADSGKPPYEFIRDLLIEENSQVGMVIFMMTEENLRRILAHPLVSVGTDGNAVAPYGLLGRGKPHPRYYGTFPRVLGKYVREERLVPLAEMIKKMTSMPARKFGLTGRGVLQSGNFADLVVFDPDRIIDKATWSEPHQFPVGVEYVLVNGGIVIERGSHTGKLPGTILRKNAAA